MRNNNDDAHRGGGDNPCRMQSKSPRRSQLGRPVLKLWIRGSNFSKGGRKKYICDAAEDTKVERHVERMNPVSKDGKQAKQQVQ
jgi:hypothetical protein